MPVDLLIRNAHILTQDASRPIATSLLIHDGKILEVDPDPSLPVPPHGPSTPPDFRLFPGSTMSMRTACGSGWG